MSNVIPFRRPAGTPSGGQFAAKRRAESDVDLSGAGMPSAATTSEAGAYRPPSAPVNHAPDEYYPDVRGEKYTGWRDAAAIAKDVRKDIKDAVAAGYLPASLGSHDLTYSVTCEKYAGGQSVNVEIRGMADRDLYGERDEYGYPRQSEVARDLASKVERIAKAYNKSRTEVMTDYFDETYYCSVDIENESRAASRIHEKSMSAFKKEMKQARANGADDEAILGIKRRAALANEAHQADNRARNAKFESERHAWLEQRR